MTRSRLVYFAELIPLALIALVPLSVHAGMLASLFGLLGEETIAYERPSNDTTAGEVKLLSSTVNPDPTGALGGGDIIVDEGVLLSGGPFGYDEYADNDYSGGEISIYQVREGDSLSQIAEMFDVTTNTVLWANDLRSATDIHPGDSLVILPIVGVRHVIKDGDTIGSIAKKYESDSDEILSYNQLASADDLAVGETLIIPGGNMHDAAPKRPASSPSAPTKVTGSVASSGFTHPLPGGVRTQGLHGYNAVDLAAPYGTPILAAAAGEVIVAKTGGWNGGYGNYLVIRHPNGTQTLYSHNSSNAVGVGAYVSAGQVIGYIGNTGRSTGPHLHFEVRGASNPF